MTKRYGELPANLLNKILNISDPALLEEIGDQIFTARTLADLVIPNGTTQRNGTQ